MQIFIKIHEIISKPQEQLFSSIIFDSLTELLKSIDSYVDSQVVQRDDMADEKKRNQSLMTFLEEMIRVMREVLLTLMPQQLQLLQLPRLPK